MVPRLLHAAPPRKDQFMFTNDQLEKPLNPYTLAAKSGFKQKHFRKALKISQVLVL